MFVLWKTHYEEIEILKEENYKLVARHKEHITSLDKEREKLERLYNEQENKFNAQKAIAYKTMELKFKDEMQTVITNLDKDHQAKISKLKEDYEKKLEHMRNDNFNKLKDSLSKLHEEGNSQTKYLEKLSLKMLDVAGLRPSDKQIGNNSNA